MSDFPALDPDLADTPTVRKRILDRMSAETRMFDPTELPLPDSTTPDHHKVQELRELSLWSEGQVWSNSERHGAIAGIMKKAQIDWSPLEIGSVRPTQGRNLAVMQVPARSQSFNAVNTLRLLGRGRRMITIPTSRRSRRPGLRSTKPAARAPSNYYERVVDVMEELSTFNLLTRQRAHYPVDRYSERKTAGRPPVQVELGEAATAYEPTARAAE